MRRNVSAHHRGVLLVTRLSTHSLITLSLHARTYVRIDYVSRNVCTCMLHTVRTSSVNLNILLQISSDHSCRLETYLEIQVERGILFVCYMRRIYNTSSCTSMLSL